MILLIFLCHFILLYWKFIAIWVLLKLYAILLFFIIFDSLFLLWWFILFIIIFPDNYFALFLPLCLDWYWNLLVHFTILIHNFILVVLFLVLLFIIFLGIIKWFNAHISIKYLFWFIIVEFQIQKRYFIDSLFFSSIIAFINFIRQDSILFFILWLSIFIIYYNFGLIINF